MKVHHNVLCRYTAIPRSLPLFTIALLVAFAQTNSAQQAATPTSTPVVSNAPANVLLDAKADSWYRIGPGDVIEVTVYNRPQLSTIVRVNERGLVSIPLLGYEFPASCRTERELAREIADGYVKGKFLRNPQVNVFIKEYQANPVAVLGAVNAAGRFQLQRQMRLLELLLFAGGPSATAGNTIRVLHTTDAPPCGPSFADAVSAENIDKNIVSYSLSDTMRGIEEANPYVRPGDVITIPDGGTALIMGNVLKPGPVPVNETTLSNAIAQAGGTLPDSKGEVLIRRRVSGSTTTTDVIANLSAIKKRQANDILLQPGDIVEVAASSGFGQVLKGMLRTVVPTMSTLPIRVIRPF